MFSIYWTYKGVWRNSWFVLPEQVDILRAKVKWPIWLFKIIFSSIVLITLKNCSATNARKCMKLNSFTFIKLIDCCYSVYYEVYLKVTSFKVKSLKSLFLIWHWPVFSSALDCLHHPDPFVPWFLKVFRGWSQILFNIFSLKPVYTYIYHNLRHLSYSPRPQVSSIIGIVKYLLFNILIL